MPYPVWLSGQWRPQEESNFQISWFEARRLIQFGYRGNLVDWAGTDPARPGLQPGALPTELPNPNIFKRNTYRGVRWDLNPY